VARRAIVRRAFLFSERDSHTAGRKAAHENWLFEDVAGEVGRFRGETAQV